MENKQKMDDEKTMDESDESKKEYEKPELKVHGDLREITKSGGGSHVDVPIGTNVINDDINSITS
ncbi:MAG: lasso RiPP family leader peptide-containing protein [Chloroflexi bacterium]|nr:lasso RiPP family leader peptide-containing protein [Chloroflexota bacterium]